jgi:diguanylate cyclase (GGDEF)-like protein/PAS domain S-box-containing protein
MSTYPAAVAERLSPKFRDMRWRLLVSLLLLNLLVLVLTAYSLWRDRQQYEQRVVVATRNTAQLLERDVSALFNRVDYVLHTVAEEFVEHSKLGRLDDAWLNAYLKLQQTHIPEVVSLRMTDAQGRVVYGGGISPGAVRLDDQHFFQAHRDNPDAELVIDKPLLARISKVWSIPISRRLHRQDGSFAGIVYVNLPVAHLVKMFSDIDVGPSGQVSLRTLNYELMARYPALAEPGAGLGQVAVSNTLLAMLTAGYTQGSYATVAPTDHVLRTYAFQRLSAYPLYMLVGQAPQDYLRDWWKNVAETLVLVALFVLTSCVAAWLLYRNAYRLMRTGRALAESEERWSLALEARDQAVWDWDVRRGQVQLSKAGKQLFGFADHEIGNSLQEWAARCHPDDAARVLAAVKDHFRARTENLAVTFRVRAKDGHWLWIRTHGKVVRRAPDGKPLRVVGTHRDVTERQWREEEQRLAATVLELADEAVLVTDPRNRIISVNPAFTVITGYAAQEVLGRNPSLLSAGRQNAEFYQQMWQSLESTGTWAGEVVNRKKTGEIYVEWLSIKQVRDELGALTHHVAVFSDITERKAAEARMRHLALHDVLTGLPNRALLTERVEQAVLRAEREQSRLGLLYFDLDKFKPVNDRYGHEVGDLLLKEVAARVNACVRASDTVARLGGDEFVVLLPHVDSEAAALGVAEKIRAALNQPFMVAGHALDISTSMGLAIYPEHGADEQTLTRHADEAMYQAKQQGRNRVVIWHAGS